MGDVEIETQAERDERGARWIRKWFERVSAVERRTVYKSPVYRAIRDGLKVWGNWKGLPRGNPVKGRAAQKKVVGW